MCIFFVDCWQKSYSGCLVYGVSEFVIKKYLYTIHSELYRVGANVPIFPYGERIFFVGVSVEKHWLGLFAFVHIANVPNSIVIEV